MDGTLTLHRQQITPEMIYQLRLLMKQGIVAIITGSKLLDLRYQINLDHLKELLTERELNKLVLMPCNGTKIYQWNLALNEWTMTDSVSMKENSLIDLQKLYRAIIKCQQILLDKENYMGEFEIQPDFIDYRESLINWSPIGRSSSISQRQLFINLDSRVGLRDYAINLLQSMLLSDKVMSTQLDILYQMYQRWEKHNNKLIINLGSNTSDGIKKHVWPYAAAKAATDKACEQLSYLKDGPKVCNLRFGYIDFPHINKIAPNEKKISVVTALNSIQYVIDTFNSGNTVRELTVIP